MSRIEFVTTLLVSVAIVGILAFSAVALRMADVKKETDAEHRKWVCMIRNTFTEDQCDFIANELYYAMQNE